MNARTETLLEEFKPVVAIMVYSSSREPMDGGFYLESHDVNDSGEIMAGKPLKQETIQGMVDVFFDERQNSSQLTGLFPDNLLSYQMLPGGYYSMAWWQPAQMREMYFASQLAIPSGSAHVPALLYKVEKSSLSVFAMAKDERPIAKTILYKAPFHNTGDDGLVCLGNAKIKKPIEPSFASAIKYWEDLFWRSEFSHLNGAKNPTKTDLSLLWRKMIKNKKLKWDNTELRKSSFSIEKVIR